MTLPPRSAATLRKAFAALFGALDDETFETISGELEEIHTPGGTSLFRQGDPGDALYLLLHGRLHVSIRNPETGREELIGEVIPGEAVGEIGLISGESRTATLRAARDSLLVRIDKNAFDRMAEREPRLVRNLAEVVVGRLRNQTTRSRFSPRVSNLALALQPDNGRVRGFVNALAAELATHGPTGHLEPGDYAGRFGHGTSEPPEDRAAVTAWLEEEESDRRFLLLEQGEGFEAWNLRCVRQADALITIVDGDLDPEASAADRRAPGGGARGFAHIGIFRALRERGIDVDWVGGTSIGSVFGAAIAHDWDPDKVQAMSRTAFVEGKPMSGLTLPLVSVLNPVRLERLVETYFDIDIEDLVLPFFAMATNLSEAKEVVQERGRLADAVRASVSIPGVFPPAVAGNDLMVDGGILNNLPADIMATRPVGKIIAVNLAVKKEHRLDYSKVPSPWRILASRLPFMKRIRVPGVVIMMLKAMELGSLVHAREVMGDADLVLQPPVGRFGLLETRAFDEIVRLGYDYAAEQLEALGKDAPF